MKIFLYKGKIDEMSKWPKFDYLVSGGHIPGLSPSSRLDKQLAEYNESPTSSDNQSHGHIYLQTFVQFNNVIEELYRISSKNSI